MARGLFPSTQQASTLFSGAANQGVYIYTDSTGRTLANIQTADGRALSSSTVELDANGKIPQFLSPDPAPAMLYARLVKGGGVVTLHPYIAPKSYGVTGSRGGNAALASLITQLATLGIVVDNTTA